MSLQRKIDHYISACHQRDLDQVSLAYRAIRQQLLEEQGFERLCEWTLDYIEYLNNNGLNDQMIQTSVEFLFIKERYQVLEAYPQFFNIMGMIHYLLEDYEGARDYCFKELQIYEVHDNWKKVAITKGNLGEMYLLIGDVEKARETLEDVRRLLVVQGLEASSLWIYNQLRRAKYHLQVGEYELSGTYLDEILQWEHIDRVNNIRYELYKAYGDLSYQQEAYEQAILYYQEAEELLEEGEDVDSLGGLYLDISRAYDAWLKVDKSHRYLKKYTEYLETKKVKYQDTLKQNFLNEIKIHRLMLDEKERQGH